MDQELAGQSVAKIPDGLRQSLEHLLQVDPIPSPLVRLGLRLAHPRAFARAITIINDRNAPETERLQMIQTLGETNRNAGAAALLQVLSENPPAKVAMSILTALERSDHSDIPGKIMALYPGLSESLKEQAVELLCSRKAWALALLEAINRQDLPHGTLSLAQLRRIQLHDDPAINALLEKSYGKIRVVSNDEVQERVAALTKSIEATPGVAVAGKAVFVNNCGKCHQFMGLGTAIGPNLSNAERTRLDVFLANVLDPSGVVRPEFQSYVAVTNDGRVLTGLLAESTPRTITLLDPANNRIVIAREDLEGDLKASTVSLMPDRLLDKLSAQEISDLVAFLQSDRPAKPAAAK